MSCSWWGRPAYPLQRTPHATAAAIPSFVRYNTIPESCSILYTRYSRLKLPNDYIRKKIIKIAVWKTQCLDYPRYPGITLQIKNPVVG